MLLAVAFVAYFPESDVFDSVYKVGLKVCKVTYMWWAFSGLEYDFFAVAVGGM